MKPDPANMKAKFMAELAAMVENQQFQNIELPIIGSKFNCYGNLPCFDIVLVNNKNPRMDFAVRINLN